MEANKSLAQLSLEIAISQIGVHETKNNSGPEVDIYLKSVGLPPGNSWCMAFVYWCYDQAAKKLGVSNPLYKTGGVLKQWNETPLAHKIPVGMSLKLHGDPKPGSIFIMDFGGGLGHTGIVQRAYGGFVDTVDGNTNNNGSREGDRVCPKTRKIAAMKGFIEF